MIAYVDDVALIVVAKSIEEVQYLGEVLPIEVVGASLNDHGLSLAAENTEAVLISRTKKRAYATLTVNDKKIKMGDTIK